MLSPDVPEFVPREFRKTETTSNVGYSSQDQGNIDVPQGFHHASSYEPYSYSIAQHYSPEHTVNNRIGNWSNAPSWREGAAAGAGFRSHRTAYKPNPTTLPVGNWRSANNDNWNSSKYGREEYNKSAVNKKKARVRLANNGASQEVRQTRTDEKGKLINTAGFAGQRMYGQYKKIHTSNDYGNQQFETLPTARKTEVESNHPDMDKKIDQISIVKDHVNKEGNSVEGRPLPFQRKTSLNVLASSEGSHKVKGKPQSKVEWPEISMHVKHNNVDASYKKILSRKSEDKVTTEKPGSSVNLVPTPSDEQWPSLSVAQQPQKMVNRLDSNSTANVWMKKDVHHEDVTWPGPISKKEAFTSKPSSNFKDVKNLGAKNKGEADHKKNKGENYQGKYRASNGRFVHEANGNQFTNDNHQKETVWESKNQKSDRTNFHDGAEDLRNGRTYKSHKPNVVREKSSLFSEKTNRGYEKEDNGKNSKRHGNKSKYKDEIEPRRHDKSDRSDRLEWRSNTKQSSRDDQNKSSRFQQKFSQSPSVNEDLKTSKNMKFEQKECVTTNEDSSLEWQVKKKKKAKIKQQQEEELVKTASSTSKFKNRQNEAHGRGTLQTKNSQVRKFADDKETFKDTKDGKKGRSEYKKYVNYEKSDGKKAEGSVHGNKNYGKNCQENNHNFKNVHGNEAYKKSKIASGNTVKGQRSEINKLQNLQKPAASFSGNEKTTVVNEAVRKANAERKAKQKEEKIRKRESRIKKEQALMMADTKVRMVNKDVREMMHDDSSLKNNKSSKSVEREKSYQYGGKSFQLSLDDYPSLMQTDPKVAVISEDFVESVLDDCDSDGDDIQSTSNECPDFTDLIYERIVAEMNMKENSAIERHKTSDKRILSKKTGDSTGACTSEASVPSYSKALLASPKRKTVREPPQEVPKKITTPKKKVKTKDGIVFDLMDAVTMKKTKRKEKNARDLINALNKPAKTGDSFELDLLAAARSNKKIRNKSALLLAALDPSAFEKREDTSTNNRGERDSDFKQEKGKKNIKTRSEVVVKRGKQREGQRKKKLSTLKKAMKRARLLEAENLMSVMQEAKKLHESSIPNTTTGDGSDTQSASAVKHVEPPGVLSSYTDSLDNCNDSELAETEFSDENAEVHLHTSSKSTKNEESKTENKEESSMESSGGVDPEFSKKCQEIAEELGKLENPVHKNTFREYCNHVITPEVNFATTELIRTLVRFQERQFQRDPVKARMRRRYVCGLRSTNKAMGKLSCVIAAPNIARCKGPGALDEVVEKMLGQAEKHGVPVIFALTMKRIGYLCLKAIPVSCIGIINYHGAQDTFHKLMELLPEAQKQYQKLIAGGSRAIPVGDGESSGDEALPEDISSTAGDTSSTVTSKRESPKAGNELIPQNRNVEVGPLLDAAVDLNTEKGKGPLVLSQDDGKEVMSSTAVDLSGERWKKAVSAHDTREEVIASTVAILCADSIPAFGDKKEGMVATSHIAVTKKVEE